MLGQLCDVNLFPIVIPLRTLSVRQSIEMRLTPSHASPEVFTVYESSDLPFALPAILIGPDCPQDGRIEPKYIPGLTLTALTLVMWKERVPLFVGYNYLGGAVALKGMQIGCPQRLRRVCFHTRLLLESKAQPVPRRENQQPTAAYTRRHDNNFCPRVLLTLAP